MHSGLVFVTDVHIGSESGNSLYPTEMIYLTILPETSNEAEMNICLFENQQHSDKFWEKHSGAFPSDLEILHQGELYTLSNDCLLPETYVLTKNQLIKISESHVMEVGDIRWVTIFSFLEYRKKQVRCGFTIKHANEKIDCYAADQESLDEWLKHLETLSILQDIRSDYRVGKVIGSGGQSVVRLGTSIETGERVAIKVYDKRILHLSRNLYTALVSEISILRELSHPNIVKLYRVYESTSSVYLVMEYVAGKELHECLKFEGRFSKKDASKFMWNLLDTLQYLEKKNVVHRDLKPENIILTDPRDKSQFRLVDFGLAIKYEGTDVLDTCGSPGYIAPEILMKRKHGPKVDIYSAGILFYVLLSGHSPFFSSTRAETLKKNCDNDITFGSDWLHIGSKLVRIIRMMTNFNPDLRMPITDLKDWLIFDSPNFPCSHRRASAVDAIQPDCNLLMKAEIGDIALGRDSRAALEAEGECHNAVSIKIRRGSLPCDPEINI